MVHVIESWKLKTQDREEQHFCHFLGINIVIFHLRYDTCSYTYINWVQEMFERFGAHKPCMRFFQQGSLGTRNFWIVWIQKCGHNHSFAREYLQENFIFQMIFDIGIFGGGEESSSFTQERFTDHEGGRSLSLVFQFTSHLLISFSIHVSSFNIFKICFFHTSTPFCPAGFAWLFHILFFVASKQS